MINPINALLDTINPKGGNGMKETIIFLIIIAVLLALNIMQIPVSEELQYALYTILGYMVGTNAKKKIDGTKKEG
jgi:hypothetical protein